MAASSKSTGGKSYAIVDRKDKSSNLRQDYMLYFLCALKRLKIEDIKEILKHLGYYVNNAQEVADALVRQELLTEAPIPGYYKLYSYTVNFDCIREILLSHDIEEVKKARLEISDLNDKTRYYYYQENKDNYYLPDKLAYLKSLTEFVHGDANFAADFGECGDYLIYIINEKDDVAGLQLLYMTETPAFSDFVMALPKKCLNELREILLDRMADLSKVYDHEKLKHLFFDKTGIAYTSYDAILFVMCTELFVNGRVDELIAKYDVAAPSGKRDNEALLRYLRAVKQLHEGDPMPMVETTLEFVDNLTFDLLAIPPFGWYAMVATAMAAKPEIVKLMSKAIKPLELYHASMVRSVLEWMQKSKIGKRNLDRLEGSEYRPSTKMLFAYFILFYELDQMETVYKVILSDATRRLLNSKFDYLKMNFFALKPDLKGGVPSLSKSCEMTALFADRRQRQDWEIALDKIKMQIGGVRKSATVASERISYLISEAGEIQPILQKSTGGSWSSGRNIALKTLKAGKVASMTQQDLKIAGLVKENNDYWGPVSYYIPARRGLYALAGNPNLFTNDNLRLKIEITELVPQLSVTRSKSGDFKLATNIKPACMDEQGYYVDISNKLNITVAKLSTGQMGLLRSLATLKSLPADSEKKLAEVLDLVSSQMTVMSDLVSDSANSNIKKVKSSSVIVAQLVPDGEFINVNLYVKPLVSEPPYLTPGKGAEFVNGTVKGTPVQARRDLEAELKNLRAVEEMLKDDGDSMTGTRSWQLDMDRTLELLARIAGAPEQAAVEWPEGVKMKVSRPALFPSDLSVKVKNSNNWFELEGELRIDDKTMITMAELLQLVRGAQGRFIRLKGDEYVALSQHLADTLKSISRLADVKTKKAGMSALNIGFLQQLEESGANVQTDRATKALAKRIDEAANAQIRTPRGIQADLRDYQKDGYRWMARLALWGAGGCLADDMGLGKTLQTICLLYARRDKGASLVVAPTSLLLNWRDEIARFAPSLNVTVLNDTNDSAKRKEIVDNASTNDVVVTSYGLLVNEQDALTGKKWNVIALDEAHTIKNRDTKMSHAAMELQGEVRMALTGTPLQNRLSEIWNIFQFINPGLLGSFQSFTDRFIIPIEKDNNRVRQKLLKQIISPFLLRRTKNDVLSELPQKTDIEVKVELSAEERALYETLRREAELAVEEGGQNSAILALAEITRLRKAACNARLINPKLTLESSKMEAFMEIVDNLHSNHHRALVFSQFTSHLALVRERLDKAGVEYLYLDGSTPAAERARLVQEFQGSDIPLFLISLKAGGLGLNLTAADYVIHMDPWWNPAIEEQASDRSHRIGQTKPVTVYRIIAADTIEEKILRLHAHKKSLADALLEGSDMSARMTRDEILALLSKANS